MEKAKERYLQGLPDIALTNARDDRIINTVLRLMSMKYLCECYELQESDFKDRAEMIHHILHELGASCGTCQDYILDVVIPEEEAKK